MTDAKTKSNIRKERPNNEPYEMTVVNSDTAIKRPKKLISVILIIALLVIASGLFLWYKLYKPTTETTVPTLRPSATENNEPESTTAEAQTESFSILSSSNEIPAIEADLQSTDLDSLIDDLKQIDATFAASLQQPQ